MDNFYTVKEFAKKVQLHPNTIRKYLRNNILHSVKFTNGPKAHHFIPESEMKRLANIRFEDVVNKEVERRLKHINIQCDV